MRVAAVVFALGVAGTAGAADVPRAEGFGAYSYARSEDVGLHGWSATLGYNFTRRVEVEAEVSAHYGGVGDGTDVGRQSFLAGPRVNFRAGKVTPFLRALAGAVRTSAGVTVQGVNISARKTSLGSAAGGGVDFALGRSWGLRLQADYVLVRTDGELFGDPRASVGLSYRLSHFSSSK